MFGVWSPENSGGVWRWIAECQTCLRGFQVFILHFTPKERQTPNSKRQTLNLGVLVSLGLSIFAPPK